VFPHIYNKESKLWIHNEQLPITEHTFVLQWLVQTLPVLTTVYILLQPGTYLFKVDYSLILSVWTISGNTSYFD
jgi:hypothetical protein